MNLPLLHKLIEAWVDGDLAEEQLAELERLLRTEPEARREFWQQATIHGLLREAAEVKWAPGAPDNQQTLVDAEDTPNTPRHTALKFAAAAMLAFILAGMALLLSGWPALRNKAMTGTAQPEARPETRPEAQPGVPTAPTYLAQVVRMAGCEWIEPPAGLHPDGRLGPGMLRLAAGAVQLRLATGAQVILEAPADLKIVGADKLVCSSGKLRAATGPSAGGLTIVTPAITITAPAAEFGVLVLPDKPVEVHVFAGSAKLSGGDELPEPRVLSAGDGLRIKTGKVQPIPARKGAFMSEAELARRAAAEQPAPATGPWQQPQ